MSPKRTPVGRQDRRNVCQQCLGDQGAVASILEERKGTAAIGQLLGRRHSHGAQDERRDSISTARKKKAFGNPGERFIVPILLVPRKKERSRRSRSPFSFRKTLASSTAALQMSQGYEP
jgi:hypothetical protein